MHVGFDHTRFALDECATGSAWRAPVELHGTKGAGHGVNATSAAVRRRRRALAMPAHAGVLRPALGGGLTDEVNVAHGIRVPGTYFENCNCDVSCP